MTQTTPEAAFSLAQEAMRRQNWHSFFGCLDRDDLLRIAANSVNVLLDRTEQTPSIVVTRSLEYAIPKEHILQLQELRQQMTGSAHAITEEMTSSPEVATSPDFMLQNGFQHWQIVDAYNQSLKALLRSASNLADLTATFEQDMRAIIGGGSVSSRLFVDEQLENLVIEGNRAWATRRMQHGWAEDIGFIRRKGVWYIKLIAKRPKRLSA
jgi:hypothetical protein